jgi:fructuronate reductase
VDPLSERLFEIGHACQNRAALDLPAFLALEQVFPPALAGVAAFRQTLARAYDALANKD